MKRPSIFLSYSHKDEREKERLVTQLKVIENAGLIDIWSDDRLKVGDNWKGGIDRSMTEASAAILLISANFLASEFIQNVEVPGIIERHRKAGLKVFPVIARECAWDEVPWLVKMNVRPKSGKPVWRVGGRYVNEELAKIAKEIAGIFKGEPKHPETASERAAVPSSKNTLLQPVKEAVEAIDDDFERIRKTAQPIDPNSISAIIALAISYGAPLYERGGIRACAEIYLHAAKALLPMLQHPGPQPITDTQFSPETAEMKGKPAHPKSDGHRLGIQLAHSQLLRVETFESVTEKNADSIAWGLRHAFDHIRITVQAISEIDAVLGSPEIEKYPVERQIIITLNLASIKANLIYEKGLSRSRNWIRGCAAVYLYAALELRSRLSGLKVPMGSYESVRFALLELKWATGETEVTYTNAYKIAWELRFTFNRIIKRLTPLG